MSAAMGCHVAPMDIHHQNDEHDVQYRLAKTRYFLFFCAKFYESNLLDYIPCL